MLSGVKARREGNPVALAHAISTQGPPSLQAVWPEAPAGLDELLRRGMARDPRQRPRSAGELVARLRAALEPEDTAQVPTERVRSAPAVPPRRMRRPAAARPAPGRSSAAAARAVGRCGRVGARLCRARRRRPGRPRLLQARAREGTRLAAGSTARRASTGHPDRVNGPGGRRRAPRRATRSRRSRASTRWPPPTGMPRPGGLPIPRCRASSAATGRFSQARRAIVRSRSPRPGPSARPRRAPGWRSRRRRCAPTAPSTAPARSTWCPAHSRALAASPDRDQLQLRAVGPAGPVAYRRLPPPNRDSSSRKTLKMSRKIDAAIGTELAMSARRSRLKSKIVNAPNTTSPSTA